MERYTKGERGQRIHYRYTKETDAEFIERSLKGFARDNNYLTEAEIQIMIENFVVTMGFSRNEEKRKSEVLRLLILAKTIVIIIPIIIALTVRTLWMEWSEINEISNNLRLQKEVAHDSKNAD